MRHYNKGMLFPVRASSTGLTTKAAHVNYLRYKPIVVYSCVSAEEGFTDRYNLFHFVRKNPRFVPADSLVRESNTAEVSDLVASGCVARSD